VQDLKVFSVEKCKLKPGRLKTSDEKDERMREDKLTWYDNLLYTRLIAISMQLYQLMAPLVSGGMNSSIIRVGMHYWQYDDDGSSTNILRLMCESPPRHQLRQQRCYQRWLVRRLKYQHTNQDPHWQRLYNCCDHTQGRSRPRNSSFRESAPFPLVTAGPTTEAEVKAPTPRIPC